MDEVLRIENLSKNFGKKKVLENYSMSLAKGKVYGLLGKNGEGKTTLIRMIMGVIPPDSGEIFYKGKKIKFNTPFYKKEVGYIPEESIFFSWMTIDGILNFNSSFYPSWSAQKASNYLDRLSLSRKLKIKNLSRGMKLKLGLIIALAAEPELLILDDPTSGLDVPTRHDFLKDIIREILESGTTVLFSSHLVHELEGIIDQLGILHHGNLILEEDFEKVKNSTKRVRIIADSLPDEIPIEGILTKQTNGNKCELVVYPWNEDKRKELEILSPTKIEVESLTLEEIFINFVSQD
jgi:ABC-2 type transport system ATP-binding protein